MVRISVCPNCGGRAGQPAIPDHNAQQLASALGLELSPNNKLEFLGFMCLCCMIPYLVIIPTAEDAEDCQKLAGFLPKGGR